MCLPCASPKAGKHFQPPLACIARQTVSTPNVRRIRHIRLFDIFGNMTQNTAKPAAFLASPRSKLNMSLRAVEQETGISNAYLSQSEHGRIKMLSPQSLYKLAQLHRVPYELLLDRAGYSIPKSQPAEMQSAESTLSARIGAVTEEEEEALVEYVQSIRSRRRRC